MSVLHRINRTPHRPPRARRRSVAPTIRNFKMVGPLAAELVSAVLTRPEAEKSSAANETSSREHEPRCWPHPDPAPVGEPLTACAAPFTRARGRDCTAHRPGVFPTVSTSPHHGGVDNVSLVRTDRGGAAVSNPAFSHSLHHSTRRGKCEPAPERSRVTFHADQYACTVGWNGIGSHHVGADGAGGGCWGEVGWRPVWVADGRRGSFRW